MYVHTLRSNIICMVNDERGDSMDALFFLLFYIFFFKYFTTECTSYLYMRYKQNQT